MDEMAARGFRTLAYAFREIVMDRTDEKLFIRALKGMEPAQIECDLKLLGITAVEDLLQQDVSKCIKDFHDAKIRTWILTGDKDLTAR